MKADLDATGEGARFDWFVLSDTTDARIAAQEETRIRPLARGGRRRRRAAPLSPSLRQ